MVNTIAFTSIKPLTFTANSKQNNEEGTPKPKKANLVKTTALAGLMALSSVGMAQVATANNDSNAVNSNSTEITTQDKIDAQKIENLMNYIDKNCSCDNDSLETVYIKSFIKNNKETALNIMNTKGRLIRAAKAEKFINQFKEENPDLFNKGNDSDKEFLPLAFIVLFGCLALGINQASNGGMKPI